MDYLFQIDFCSSFHEFTVTSDTDFLCDLTATVDVHAKNGRIFWFPAHKSVKLEQLQS